MAILSRVSQRALWLRRRRIISMPVSTGVGAEVPGKPRKHHGEPSFLAARKWFNRLKLSLIG